MMNETRLEKLFQAFQEEEPFWEDNYADEGQFEGLNLYEWLECNGSRPSRRMIDELAFCGYEVFPVERDGFGWLIGGIRRLLDPSGKVITFG